MSKQAISREIALRIALAARSLPDTDVPRLINVLDDAIGLPPTAEKLSGLKLKMLKEAADGELSGVDTDSLKQALSILSGRDEIVQEEPVMEFDHYHDGDMPGSLRIACASNREEQLDGHFGSCRRFLIYQVSEDEIRLIDARDTNGPESRDDKNAYRAGLISDCQVLFVASIGGPAAAKVVKAGVHPIKQPGAGSARERLQDLQKIISSAPPPWLAKAMGRSAEDRVRFERSASE